VKTELDLGDRSEWIRVERDPTLCQLHNGDVGIFVGGQTLGRNLVSLCLSFQFTSCSCSSLFLLRV
jgi:hypothetical protein